MRMLTATILGAAMTNVAQAAGGAAMPDGRRIVNMVDDFLVYYEAAKDRPDSRPALWDARLESKHPDFFNQVIYRNFKDRQRAEHKAYCLTSFWTEVAPKIDALRRVNADAEKRLLVLRERFAETFDDFDPRTDFYLTVSFSFIGKVADLNGKPTLALSLDRFALGDVEFDITAMHEMFHLYHGKTFSTAGAAYRALWEEGLATYVSSVLVPGQRDRVYLHFAVEKMNECARLQAALSADLVAHLTDPDPVFRRRYFGAEANATRVPPEAGYYVGYRLCERLAKDRSLKDLARLSADEARAALRPLLVQFAGQTTDADVQALLYPKP
jgi:hypothetical protein